MEVDGIKILRSASTENRSYVILQVDPDVTTGEEVKADVQDIVDRVEQELPEDSESPVVTTIESQIIPIIEVALYGDLSEEELRGAAKTLEKRLRRINQVARVDFKGLRDYEIKVKADPQKLRRYQISLDETDCSSAAAKRFHSWRNHYPL